MPRPSRPVSSRMADKPHKDGGSTSTRSKKPTGNIQQRTSIVPSEESNPESPGPSKRSTGETAGPTGPSVLRSSLVVLGTAEDEVPLDVRYRCTAATKVPNPLLLGAKGEGQAWHVHFTSPHAHYMFTVSTPEGEKEQPLGSRVWAALKHDAELADEGWDKVVKVFKKDVSSVQDVAVKVTLQSRLAYIARAMQALAGPVPPPPPVVPKVAKTIVPPLPPVVPKVAKTFVPPPPPVVPKVAKAFVPPPPPVVQPIVAKVFVPPPPPPKVSAASALDF